MKITFSEADALRGITTRVHEDGDGKVVIEKAYDAQPFLDLAVEARAVTSTQRWGEMRHVGFIPAAQFGVFLRQDGGDDLAKRCLEWLRQNPALVTFDKALK